MKGGRHFSSAKAMPSTSSTSRTVVDRPSIRICVARPHAVQLPASRSGTQCPSATKCGRRLGCTPSGRARALRVIPIFDNFYAAQVGGAGTPAQTEEGMKAAGAALLDKIGPAIVIGHSQSGNFLWILADTRPKLVLGMVGLEPGGPPFYDVTHIGPPEWFRYSTSPNKPWGLTRVPLSYDPPVSDPADLKPVQEAQAQGPDLIRCYRQSEPIHRLPKLTGIPILILSGEASFHAPFDHCTSQYLNQAGGAHVRATGQSWDPRERSFLAVGEK